MKEKLEIPCSYQGGKQRLARQIVDIFFQENKIDDYTQFYDICCGSGAISIELLNRGIKAKNIHMVDRSPWGLIWQMLGEGSFDLSIFKEFIETIPKDIRIIKQYASDIIKRPVNENMIPYHFLFLQACAFGSTATWIENNNWCKAGGLRDYWLPTGTSNRRSPVNPMMPMPQKLYDRMWLLYNQTKGLNGYCMDVFDFIYIIDEEWEIKNNKNIIIYIDPPYQNTQQYGYTFNIYELERQIWNNVPIYISEGRELLGANKTYLLSNGRVKGNINGKVKKKPIEEWLNKFGY